MTVSSISWVPKGVAKYVPDVAEEPSKEQIEELLKSGIHEKRDTGGDDDDAESDEEMDVDAATKADKVAHALAAAEAVGRTAAGTNCDDITDGLRELDMDNYDNDDDDGIKLFSSGLGDTYYPSNKLDPYLLDKNDSDSEELEDLTIKAEDVILVCARNEDDTSLLEVWIYEESEDGPNMYVHHDILIPSFPLCTAWLDFPLKGGEKGNFIAVGSMEPAIEIWDLDIINEVQPHVVLGGQRKKKKGKKRSTKLKKDSHTDAVLGLAWNNVIRNVLASASADKFVKVWDVAVEKCEVTLEHHSDKVQAVAWNHHAAHVLLSGSFDHSVVMKDMRDPSRSGFNWSVPADVESLAWDPHAEHYFVVSLENGTVQGFDVRTAKSDTASESKPRFTLHAHDKAVTSVSYNSSAPDLLATGSMDKKVKLWDLSDNQPKCVVSKDPKCKKVFYVAFSQDCPSLLAIGGSKSLEMWDVSADVRVSRRFGKFLNPNKPAQDP